MFRYNLNHARLTFCLEPEIPFLIQSGDKGYTMLHPELPDITALRSHTPDGRETVMIPGSSLKGMIRAASERILRTIGDRKASIAACDPLDHQGVCQKEANRLGDDLARSDDRNPHKMGQVYKKLCLACRMFGSQALASHISFTDAFPAAALAQEQANQTERRNRVSIDRKTGGPGRGKLYETEAVTSGSFRTTIHIENFQLWQLALLSLVLRDIDEGFTRLGASKTRGFGHVRIQMEELLVGQIGQNTQPAGIAALKTELKEPYGLLTPDQLSNLPDQGIVDSSFLPFTRWIWSTPESIWATLHTIRTQAWPALTQFFQN